MSNRLERIAIHEAAHMVAMDKLFPENYPEKLTIVSDETEEIFGFFRPGIYLGEILDGTPQDEETEHFIKYATVCCAGYAATLVFGFDESLALKDSENDFSAAGRYLAQGKSEALEFFKNKNNQKVVRFIADILLECKTIEGYEELSTLLGIAYESCDKDEFYQAKDQFLQWRKDAGL